MENKQGFCQKNVTDPFIEQPSLVILNGSDDKVRILGWGFFYARIWWKLKFSLSEFCHWDYQQFSFINTIGLISIM